MEEQPPVHFAFDVLGEPGTLASIKMQLSVCTVLARLAREAVTTCAVVSVTETAAPVVFSSRRLAATGVVLWVW